MLLSSRRRATNRTMRGEGGASSGSRVPSRKFLQQNKHGQRDGIGWLTLVSVNPNDFLRIKPTTEGRWVIAAIVRSQAEFSALGCQYLSKSYIGAARCAASKLKVGKRVCPQTRPAKGLHLLRNEGCPGFHLTSRRSSSPLGLENLRASFPIHSRVSSAPC
jgi:hypothetical protein